MDIKVLVAGLGLIGIVASAGFASAGYVYRTRQESRRSARKVLYYLLELRRALILSLYDPEVGANKYMNRCRELFETEGIDVDQETIEEEFGPKIRNHIESAHEAVKPEVNSKLLDAYEAALLELAETRPIASYILKGRERLEKLLSLNSSYMSDVSDALDAKLEKSPELTALLFAFRDELKDNTERDAVDEMDICILALAKVCGRSESKKCKGIIESTPPLESRYEDPELEEMLLGMVQNIKSNFTIVSEVEEANVQG